MGKEGLVLDPLVLHSKTLIRMTQSADLKTIRGNSIHGTAHTCPYCN